MGVHPIIAARPGTAFYTLFPVAGLAVTGWLAIRYGQPFLYAVIAVGLVYGGWIILYMRKHLLERSLVKANIQTINMQIVVGILFALAVAFG